MIIRKEAIDVEARLLAMDLDTTVLGQVGEAALRARENSSPLSPPTFPGTAGWAASVVMLRQLCLPRGFRAADPGNFSMTINDDKRFYIVASTGDEHAGHQSHKLPSTKTPKGMKTSEAVRRQLAFWPAPDEHEKALFGLEGYTGFWLLMNFGLRSVHLELSSPAQIEGGKIVDWHERIILPSISFGPEGDFIAPKDGDFGPDFDVPVKRIG